MLRRGSSFTWTRIAKKRGSGAVEILMILAVAAMVCLGVCQVTGIGVDGPTGDGIFSYIDEFLKNLGLS
jgi:hypothetical protein